MSFATIIWGRERYDVDGREKQFGFVLVSRKFFRQTLEVQQISRCDKPEGWCAAMQEKEQECMRSDRSEPEMLSPYK